MDHTIRLGSIIPIEGYKQHYHELFAMMADILGSRLKRITVDILRFSPQMPGVLRSSSSEEVVSSLMAEMEPAVKMHKFRPSAHRQQHFYHWIKALLAHYGISQVRTTPCKADPAEVFLFLQAGDITSMPCACLSTIVIANVYGVANCQCCPGKQPFAFIDPFGYSDTPMSTISRLMRYYGCEVLTTFIYEEINRFLTADYRTKEYQYDAFS